MKQLLICFCLALLLNNAATGQQGKYFTTSNTKCKNIKVFIDYRVQQYCGTAFTIDWTGGCKDGFAQGKGTLTLVSKVDLRSFTMTYDGALSKGKKEGDGSLQVFLFYAGFAPYYSYNGTFKNDEFDGYGEFKADYPYPVKSENVGKGVSMESLGLNMAMWRSDLFFCEYKGRFINGRIADTDAGKGKTLRLNAVADETFYDGEIKNGMPNGNGKAYNTNPIVPRGISAGSYEGGFKNGRLEGQGKLSSGSYSYEGVFSNNALNGKGKMIYTYTVPGSIPVRLDCEIKSVEGDFANNQYNGFIIVYFQNCDAYKFEGFASGGNINGSGQVDYLNGDMFRGNFRDNMKEGKGVMNFSGGDKFDGEFVKNEPVRGIYSRKDGSWYEGEVRTTKSYKNGKEVSTLFEHGRGVMHEKDGTVKKVNCTDGNCVPAN